MRRDNTATADHSPSHELPLRQWAAAARYGRGVARLPQRSVTTWAARTHSHAEKSASAGCHSRH
jgi:hypothetical protein